MHLTNAAVNPCLNKKLQLKYYAFSFESCTKIEFCAKAGKTSAVHFSSSSGFLIFVTNLKLLSFFFRLATR